MQDRQRILLIFVFSDGLPLLTADARILRQILMNLVANAVKFTPTRPRTWTKVTQPFHQVDRGLNRRYEGTGLGLALVTGSPGCTARGSIWRARSARARP